MGALAASVSAQSVSSTCFSYVYNATAAEQKELPKQAIKGFETAGCYDTLRAKVAGLTSGSIPTTEAAVFLPYSQSKKRLDALEKAPPTPFVLSGDAASSGSGGFSVGYVVENGISGNLILRPIDLTRLERFNRQNGAAQKR